MTPEQMRQLLKMSNKKPAPRSWSDLASKFNIVSVQLVNDQRIARSYVDHGENTIYVNEKSEFWMNYSKPEFGNAKTPEESIVLKFLHELGHVACGHHLLPSAQFDSSGQTIATPAVEKKEAEAWQFVREFRYIQAFTFTQLLKDFQSL
ncbi:hypothetical protein MKY96_32535 [Paenibacillus sp. FSL R7-0302]|uniref:hypothetical protein n=1 Tax=Paenibacillus sp. FSL R7-0302 TaxID=2921681 RepID=UPI0030F9A735